MVPRWSRRLPAMAERHFFDRIYSRLPFVPICSYSRSNPRLLRICLSEAFAPDAAGWHFPGPSMVGRASGEPRLEIVWL